MWRGKLCVWSRPIVEWGRMVSYLLLCIGLAILMPGFWWLVWLTLAASIAIWLGRRGVLPRLRHPEYQRLRQALVCEIGLAMGTTREVLPSEDGSLDALSAGCSQKDSSTWVLKREARQREGDWCFLVITTYELWPRVFRVIRIEEYKMMVVFPNSRAAKLVPVDESELRAVGTLFDPSPQPLQLPDTEVQAVGEEELAELLGLWRQGIPNHTALVS